MTALETAGGVAGGTGGRWVGAAAGMALCGPICSLLGGMNGSRAGAIAGRALGGTIANMMEDTNEAAETETKPNEATQPCEDCGEIECFEPPEGSTPEQRAEFQRQLDEQQAAANRMDPGKLLD